LHGDAFEGKNQVSYLHNIITLVSACGTARRGFSSWRGFSKRFSMCLGLGMVLSAAAYAVEGGASVYPAGVETIMPGRIIGPDGTMLLEFNNFYEANELVGTNGRSLVPGFHLRVGAVAFKLIHNWGIHVLGGTLVNTVALPIVDIRLNAPFGTQNKVGVSNPDLETLVSYNFGSLHWWYGVEGFTPGFSYKKTDLVNIGQHNYATAPSAAFSYMPHHGQTEVSSKFQYIVNFADEATHYRSGSEFVWEYAGMQNITKRLAIGGNGYFYKQTTNDLQNGLMYLDGNRGRNFAFGPEIRYHFNHYAMILKYEKDFLTENRPVGSALWLQLGIPLSHGRE
jgi:hypothetical protein